ncbi:MAG: hypothetical protein HY613_11085, partial [Candidatus Rokubacteria bacterium]|nr:hypothetical protein [Candidatus Rokubacteria bacterium]
KVDGEISQPQENGTLWGVRFKAGDKLTIPEQYFNPKLFVSLEARKKD